MMYFVAASLLGSMAVNVHLLRQVRLGEDRRIEVSNYAGQLEREARQREWEYRPRSLPEWITAPVGELPAGANNDDTAEHQLQDLEFPEPRPYQEVLGVIDVDGWTQEHPIPNWNPANTEDNWRSRLPHMPGVVRG